jgi:serine phosphatase RsbU (regulator of sigma subunit)
MAASVRAVLRVASRQAGVAQALGEAGAVLHTDLHATGFLATSLHAHLDAATGDLTYADAGHGLTLVVHPDGTSTRLLASGLPLGVLPVPETAERTVHLEPGDLLVTFSDGLVERFRNSADSFPAVHDALRGVTSAQGAVDAVLRLADAQGRGRADDVTVLAVRRDDARA